MSEFDDQQKQWLQGFVSGIEARKAADRLAGRASGAPAAQIGEILTVPLNRPRKRLELVADATFLKCRQRVLEFLYERHQFVDAA